MLGKCSAHKHHLGSQQALNPASLYRLCTHGSEKRLQGGEKYGTLQLLRRLKLAQVETAIVDVPVVPFLMIWIKGDWTLIVISNVQETLG